MLTPRPQDRDSGPSDARRLQEIVQTLPARFRNDRELANRMAGELLGREQSTSIDWSAVTADGELAAPEEDQDSGRGWRYGVRSFMGIRRQTAPAYQPIPESETVDGNAIGWRR